MRAFVAASLLLAVASLLLTACSSEPKELGPTKEASAATSSAQLAFQQFTTGATLSTTAITTLEDMLDAVSESEGTLANLPARTETTDATLTDVRTAADAISRALAIVKSGNGSQTDAAASLEAASKKLSSTVDALEGSS